MTPAPTSGPIGPETRAAIEVLRHRLASVAEGMGATLQRAAFSPNIKERLDFSCAVFDGEGQLLAQAAHIPVHLGAMPASVQAARERIERWKPGDLVLLNDPFSGGSHLPDLTTVSPVFCASSARPDFFLASRAHHADIGGQAPGSLPLARDIHGEGLVIPPVRLLREGRLNEDLLRIICANSRTGQERRGDLEAQLAAHRHGETRLMDIAGATPRWKALCEALLEQSEQQAEACLRALPEGVYSAEDWLDGDGLSDETYRILARVEIREGRLAVDFSGSAGPAPSGMNAPLAVTRSALYYVLACLLEDTPINAGSLSRARLEVPAGSLLDPPFGSAVAAGNVETSQRIVDVILRALAQAAPGRIPAASQGTMNNLTIGGRDTGDGTSLPDRAFTYYETLPGGAGGGPSRAGASAIQVHMTNTLNTPIEALELAYPLRVVSCALRRGSGGAGLRPGGDGIRRRLAFLADARVTLMTERRSRGPYGLAGGEAGQAGRDRKIGLEGQVTALPAKGSVDFKAGEMLEIESPGGGGWGRAEAGDAPSLRHGSSTAMPAPS